jgi:hypothetical protein
MCKTTYQPFVNECGLVAIISPLEVVTRPGSFHCFSILFFYLTLASCGLV